jgi:hypothetical protein
MPIPFQDKVIHFDRRREIIAKEHKRKYIGINQGGHLIAKYKIDGSILSGSQISCDYLILNTTNNNAYFIELKGNHLPRGANQLLFSITTLKDDLPNRCIIHARLIVTRVISHALLSSAYIKLSKIIKQYNGTILKRSVLLKEKIS